MWLIWSIEHNAWWMPNECGYTSKRDKAGRYSLETACKIVAQANLMTGDCPHEAMVKA